MVMIVKAMSERSGIVTNPNHAKNFVVQDTPATHGPILSGIIL